ncbi:hypothetical protein M436DRAFT_66529 [Aureobasidium namibiae CBS 147.97]|uniref:Uncharacterized protein n=1 Tax=Aureobasidium namibiae CBS 147.97 TaxID=1043004 RepID=A0A074X6D7_9PEZI|nr:uncharacterized protein M436DRAFT_66529 [Aureobasidium namibiae CBS 147.97]KEQ70121.1 hypothetical protein M436DRAFT_66529 [Aureobasidium namibiae CBS 147.97]
MVLFSKLQGAKSTVGIYPTTCLEILRIQEAEVGNGGILSTRNLYWASTTGRKARYSPENSKEFYIHRGSREVAPMRTWLTNSKDLPKRLSLNTAASSMLQAICEPTPKCIMLYPSTRLQDDSVLSLQKMVMSMISFFASFFVLQLLEIHFTLLLLAKSTITSLTTVVEYTTILAGSSLSASSEIKSQTANLNNTISSTTSSLTLSSIATSAITPPSTTTPIPTTMSTSTLRSANSNATNLLISTSSSLSISKSPSASPISSTATALVLLSSATAAVSQAITPGVAANAPSTGLQVVAAIPSSSVSTSSTAERPASTASEKITQLSSSSTLQTSSASTSLPAESTASSVSTTSEPPVTLSPASSTSPPTTAGSVSSSVAITGPSSTTSILMASGGPTIAESTTNAIPTSILILPTTIPSPSSTTISSSSSSSIAAVTATSESNTSSPSATPLKSASHKLSSQEIAGISFGAVAAAAILSLILFALYRRRRAQQAAALAAAQDKRGSFPESAWLYDPRMTPSSVVAVAAGRLSRTPVSSIHSSVSSNASRRDETLLSAIATPAILPKRQLSNPIGRALTSNPPSAAKRHRISSSVPEFKPLPLAPFTATNDSTIPSPISEITLAPRESKRESLPAILKIGGGKRRPLTAAPVMQKVKAGPNKPLPPRPVLDAKHRPFSFEAGGDDAEQFGIAR